MKPIEGALQLHNSVTKHDTLLNASAQMPLSSFLSKETILDLQHYFFTPGFHTITVKDRAQGRALFLPLLHSLENYFANAMLSTQGSYAGCEDLYTIMREKRVLSKRGALEEYLAQACYYDMLFIEGTADLLQSSWFGKFEHLLVEYGILKTTSIILLSYEK